MIRTLHSIRRWWKHELPVTVELPSNGNGKANGQATAPAAEEPWVEHLERAGIPRSLVYPATTLGRLLEQSADRFGNAIAIVYGATRWTYRELLAQVNRTAGGLSSLGVRRGDRVLFALPNCPEFVTAFLAVQKLGAVVVNCGPLMGSDDLAAVMAMTTPRVALGLDLQAGSLVHAGRGSTVEHWVWVSLQPYQPVLKRLGYQYKLWSNRNGNGDRTQHIGLPELLEQAPARPPTIEPDPDKPAVLQPTGGTTGTLKLAQLTHRGLLANALQVTAVMACRPGQERFMAALPMFHVYGLTTCLITPIFSAAQMVLMTRFHADEVLDLLRRERITVFPLVPAICSAVCDEIDKQQKRQQHKPAPLDSIRLCISGAAPLPVELAQRFTQTTGAPVVEGYGLTEASPVTHVNLPSRAKAGSIGLPLPDTNVRIVKLDSEGESGAIRDVAPGEPGEMLLSGPQIMLGYFANPQQSRQSLFTDEHGKTWLRTGDIARMDEEGYFFVIDRKKDMIIRSGLKIFPAKVEQVLRRHPRIVDAAVVGRADPVHTEIVVAFVVAKQSAVKPDAHTNGEHVEQDRTQLAEELRALCREHLARYEVPEVIEFLDVLPRSALGKLLKRELRNRVPAPTAAPKTLTKLAPSNSDEHDDRPSPNGKPSPTKRPDKKQKEAA
jgi:long-chain acyl-CoA synthetase